MSQATRTVKVVSAGAPAIRGPISSVHAADERSEHEHPREEADRFVLYPGLTPLDLGEPTLRAAGHRPLAATATAGEWLVSGGVSPAVQVEPP